MALLTVLPPCTEVSTSCRLCGLLPRGGLRDLRVRGSWSHDWTQVLASQFKGGRFIGSQSRIQSMVSRLQGRHGGRVQGKDAAQFTATEAEQGSSAGEEEARPSGVPQVAPVTMQGQASELSQSLGQPCESQAWGVAPGQGWHACHMQSCVLRPHEPSLPSSC